MIIILCLFVKWTRASCIHEVKRQAKGREWECKWGGAHTLFCATNYVFIHMYSCWIVFVYVCASQCLVEYFHSFTRIRKKNRKVFNVRGDILDDSLVLCTVVKFNRVYIGALRALSKQTSCVACHILNNIFPDFIYTSLFFILYSFSTLNRFSLALAHRHGFLAFLIEIDTEKFLKENTKRITLREWSEKWTWKEQVLAWA